MLQYILKRILIFLPTLLVISLVTFAISTNAPGDPVEQMLTSQSGEGQAANLQATEKAYLELRKELGLDLPIFYFALSNQASSDTIHRVAKQFHRNNLDRLTYEYGNWEEIAAYYEACRELELKTFAVKKDSLNRTPLIGMKESINEVLTKHQPEKITNNFQIIKEKIADAPSLAVLNAPLAVVEEKYDAMLKNSTGWKHYVPSLKFYGTNNQYHRWFFGDKPYFGNDDGNWSSAGFVRGDFGKSYRDRRPVGSVIWDAIQYTFLISVISMFLTYLIAIPLGVFSAKNSGGWGDQIVTTVLFVLYSLPSFWVAVMAIMYFGGGDYFDIFPPYFSPDLDGSFFSDVKELFKYLVLPLMCWTYGSLAYLSRQMRGGMLTVLSQDYIRTAKAKGLDDRSVTWKHAMRNSMLPIITIFASVFPLAISGGLVLEIIFSIPGMGKLAYEAVVARNYPIVFAVMMFSAILTLIGYLVADILYAVVDPRISYSNKK